MGFGFFSFIYYVLLQRVVGLQMFKIASVQLCTLLVFKCSLSLSDYDRLQNYGSSLARLIRGPTY